MSPTAPRPQPRAEILEIDAYVPGKSRRPPGPARPTSSPRTRRRSAPPPRPCKRFARRPARWRFIRTAPRTRCAGASASYGLDPARLICGNGSDELLGLLAQAFLEPGDEALYSQSVSSSTRSPSGPPAERRSSPPSATGRRTSMDHRPRRRRARGRVPRQSQQPDRRLLPSRRDRAPARRTAPDTLLVLDAAYAEYVDDPRLRRGRRNGRRARERRDDCARSRRPMAWPALRVGWAYARRIRD